jgi:hypothetical protein
MIERGRAHPILGPIVVIVLVLVLAMVALHAALDRHDAASELGAICLGIAVFLGLVLGERLRSHAPAPLVPIRRDRGPPRRAERYPGRHAAAAADWRTLPLRR